MHRHNIGRRCQKRHRRQGRFDLEGIMRARKPHDPAGRGHHQRMPIRGAALQLLHADAPSTTATIFHDNRLLEAFLKMLRKNPRQHIRATTWRKGHDDGNAARWESILRRSALRQEGCGQ